MRIAGVVLMVFGFIGILTANFVFWSAEAELRRKRIDLREIENIFGAVKFYPFVRMYRQEFPSSTRLRTFWTWSIAGGICWLGGFLLLTNA